MRMFERHLPNFLRQRQPCAHGRGRHFSISASSFRAASWAALATALAGCDGNSSVVHSARLDAKPDMLCMKQAVEKVPGINHVFYLHVSGADQRAFDEISYEADDQRVMLMVEQDREYKQTFLRIGGLGGDNLMPRIRRVMASVDRAVEQSCHIRNLTRKVRETCGDASHAGGACPPLAR
jgi:hypothetical protein